MSKSKGNVIDPIAAQSLTGADAVRLGLMQGLHPGLDVNVSVDKSGAIGQGRVMVTKLWNLSKYVLSQLSPPQSSSTSSSTPTTSSSSQGIVTSSFQHAFVPLTSSEMATLPLAERWMVSRLHHAINQSTSSFEALDYGDALRASLEAMKDEFADVYVEWSKASLSIPHPSSSEYSQVTSRVLAYTMDSCLRLLHPYAPFITETVWQSIRATVHSMSSSSSASVSSFPLPSAALITAHWPSMAAAADSNHRDDSFKTPSSSSALPRDLDAEATFARIANVIRVCRGVKKDMLDQLQQQQSQPASSSPSAKAVVHVELRVRSDDVAMKFILGEHVRTIATMAKLDSATARVVTLSSSSSSPSSTQQLPQSSSTSSSLSTTAVVDDKIEVRVWMDQPTSPSVSTPSDAATPSSSSSQHPQLPIIMSPEVSRLLKQHAKLVQEKTVLMGRLSSPQFLQRASDVIKQETQDAHDAKVKLMIQVEAKLTEMGIEVPTSSS